MQKKHEILQRRVQTYLTPRYYTMFVGYAESQALLQSKAAMEIMRDFFSRMPQHVQSNYMILGKEVIAAKNKVNPPCNQ